MSTPYEVRNSSLVRDLFQDKILAKCAFFTGVSSGDSSWANAKLWAAHVEKNKSALISDSNLSIDLEFNILVRTWAFKDTDTVGNVDEQVVSYLNASPGAGIRWDYLVDDYFTDHKTLLF